MRVRGSCHCGLMVEVGIMGHTGTTGQFLTAEPTLFASNLKAAVTLFDDGVVFAREHIVWGDVVDGAVEPHTVVVLDKAGNEGTRLLEC